MLRSVAVAFRRILWPWGTALFGLGFALVFGLLALNGVDTTVTDDDREIIAKLQVDDQCGDPDDFQSEVECIAAVQSSIFERYPDTDDAFKKGVTNHSVSDYDERGFGSCYDRATLIEQSLRHYGFNVRRVALYKQQPTPAHYLKPGIRSHALSEVETSKGWMVVESIDPLLAVDDHNTPYSISKIRDGLRAETLTDRTFRITIPDDFFDGDFVYVYGVHSRHGYFFEPHLPVPEVDWSNFGLW